MTVTVRERFMRFTRSLATISLMQLRHIALTLAALLLAGIASAQSNRLVVAAAGDVPGANGTHFRSDISITNLRSVDQIVMLTWLPRAGSAWPLLRDEAVLIACPLLHDRHFEQRGL